MPPEIHPVDPPADHDRGRAAYEWLQFHGIEAVTPDVRSRDFSTCRSDPFRYYLGRRLGLVSVFKAYGDAKARGSWVHTFLQHINKDPHVQSLAYNKAIEASEQDIRDRCKAVGYSGERMLGMIDEDRKDAYCALGWLRALDQLQLPFMPKGLFAYLRSPKIKVLATELDLSVKYLGLTLTITIDRLIYIPEFNQIWFADFKSSDASPLVRAEVCPVSLQTQHYRFVGAQALDEGFFQRTYGLPADTQFGGFQHIILQKPTIVFGSKDRPYIWTAQGKRSKKSGTVVPSAFGKWTLRHASDTIACPPDRVVDTEKESVELLHAWAEKQPDRVYTGEPDPLLYAKRCLDWYQGEGDYADEKEARKEDPPINTSSVLGRLDEDEEAEYTEHLRYVKTFVEADPYPCHFPRTGEGMMTYGGKLTDFAKFYRLPVRQWPELIRHQHMIQRHIDVEPGE